MKLFRILTSAVALFAATASAAAAATITISSTDPSQLILDNNGAGITSTLVGTDITNITDINLIFDDLQHGAVSDLHIELTSPTGTKVVLVKAATESGILRGRGVVPDFVGTVFDDQASANLRDGGPYVGSFNINHSSVAANPLSLFNGETAVGTWTLFISDLARFDSGRLNNWSLEFTGTTSDDTPAVPEPTTMALLGSGLLGLAARARRRR